MNDNQNVERMKNVPPFVKFVCANVPMVFDDSLSYYEALCALWKYVQDCVDVINNNATLEEEYIAKFEELKTFVDTYFDNLDVQEEINNKLDEMADDGTLQELVNNAIQLGYGSVKYIFPSKTYYTNYYCLLQGYGKNILSDCGQASGYTELKATLAKYGVTKLDYLFISHFHTDHCGNLISLYTDGYCDENTILVLPAYDTSLWSADSSYANYTAIMAYLTDHNISYINPTEGQVFTIDTNFTLTVYNTDDTQWTEYNNASNIILVKHYENYSLLTSDAYERAMEYYLAIDNIPKTYHIYTMNHHGIDSFVMKMEDDIYPLEIKNVVQIVGTDDIAQGKCARSGNFPVFHSKTDNIYVTAYNDDNIQFESYVNSVYLNNGLRSGTDNLGKTEYNIYVDSTASDAEQDGSYAKPFKNVMQAVGYINGKNNADYTIHIADGTYDSISTTEHAISTLYGCTNTIKIEGNGNNTVLGYGFRILNCKNVQISNLKISNKIENSGFVIEASNVDLTNITYETYGDLTAQTAINISKNSNVDISNLSVSKARFGVTERDSVVSIHTATFDTLSSQALYGRNGEFKVTDGITCTSATIVGIYSNDEKPAFTKGLEIYSGTHVYTDGTITLPYSARTTRFNSVTIEYELNTYRNSKTFALTGSAQRIDIDELFVANDGNNYFFSQCFNFGADVNTINFPYSRKCTQARSDGTLTFENGVDTITLKRIVAH